MAINLTKGQKIDLRKESGEKLTNFCVGVNWGVITKKALFGLTTVKEEVDLDLSCIMTDANGTLIDHLYSPLFNNFLQKNNFPLGKLASLDGSMKHSGDDLQGDTDGDDGLDNEIITLDLNKINPNIHKVFFFINLFLKPGQNIDFAKIPYAKIRMFEGTIHKVNKVHSEFNIVTDSSFSNKRALILGKLYKRNEEWKFDAIGEPTDDQMFLQTITRILNQHAK